MHTQRNHAQERNGCLTEATTLPSHPKSQQSSSEDLPLLKNELSVQEA